MVYNFKKNNRQNIDPDDDYKKFLANVQKDQEFEKKKENNSIFVNKDEFNPKNYHFEDDEDDLDDYEVCFRLIVLNNSALIGLTQTQSTLPRSPKFAKFYILEMF